MIFYFLVFPVDTFVFTADGCPLYSNALLRDESASVSVFVTLQANFPLADFRLNWTVSKLINGSILHFKKSFINSLSHSLIPNMCG